MKARWNRTETDALRTRIMELESQLEQVRASNDLALVRDMLNRAGIDWSQELDSESNIALCMRSHRVTITFVFEANGKLKKIYDD